MQAGFEPVWGKKTSTIVLKMSNVLIGIIGTLSGAIVGFVTSEIQERNRWKRSLNIRWDETRRTLYANYLSTANVNLGKIEWASKHQEQATKEHPFALPDDFHLLGDSDNASMGESIHLIAGDALVQAAQHLLLSLWKAKEFVIRGGVRSDPEMQKLVDAFVVAREKFIQAARSELGIERLSV